MPIRPAALAAACAFALLGAGHLIGLAVGAPCSACSPHPDSFRTVAP